VTALVTALQGDEEIDGGASGHYQMWPEGGAEEDVTSSESGELDEWDDDEGELVGGIPPLIGVNATQAGTGIDWTLLKT
jgi:hypothetical protein